MDLQGLEIILMKSSILKSHGINWVGLSQIILGWKENNQLDACLESGFSVKECF